MATEAVKSVIEERYKEQARTELTKRFGYKNPMEVPRVQKVVVNMGCGELARDSKLIEPLTSNLVAITGQKPVVTKARKSVANFKIRDDMPLGLKVTLRGRRMFAFLDRLLLVAIPRIRDFRGLPTKSFDGQGNYAMGLQEQLVFPEIHYSEVERTQGMDICVVTSAKTDDEARELLRLIGVPFRNN